VKHAQFARSPSNLYLRGKTYWGRALVNKTECRRSLRTTDKNTAVRRVAEWIEELRRRQFYGEPLPTTAQPREASRIWLDSDPRHAAAHKAVQDALAAGDLIRQPCERCGDAKSQAHHDDYDRPLDVRWLCPKHHREVHKTQRKATISRTLTRISIRGRPSGARPSG
jgi:ribosomal protein S27AE